MVSFVVKLADMNSEAYLVKFKEYLSLFEIMDIFFKSHVFKKCLYLNRFYFD